MKINIYYILSFLLGFAAYYAYDFNRAVNYQIQYLQADATVKALQPLCPAVFKEITKEAPKPAQK